MCGTLINYEHLVYLQNFYSNEDQRMRCVAITRESPLIKRLTYYTYAFLPPTILSSRSWCLFHLIPPPHQKTSRIGKEDSRNIETSNPGPRRGRSSSGRGRNSKATPPRAASNRPPVRGRSNRRVPPLAPDKPAIAGLQRNDRGTRFRGCLPSTLKMSRNLRSMQCRLRSSCEGYYVVP